MFRRIFQILTGYRAGSKNEPQPIENRRGDKPNKPKFPDLEISQSIWILTSRIKWKTVGIVPGDNPINKGRIAFMWVKRVRGKRSILHKWL